MSELDHPKIVRQVRLFYSLLRTHECTPQNIMTEAGIKSRRTFERDLIDLRDSGVVNTIYDRHDQKLKFYPCEFNKSITGARRARLIHLSRLCALLCNLPQTLFDDYDDYKIELEYLEDDDEYIPDSKLIHNIIPKYESLFPNISLKTRQRDFQILNCAGQYASSQNTFYEHPDFLVEYNKRLKAYVFIIYPESYYGKLDDIFDDYE